MAPPAEPRGADPRPTTAGVQAEGAAYRPHERTSRFRIRGYPAPLSLALILAVSALLPFLAFGWPPSSPPFPGLLGSATGRYLSGFLIFLVPGALGAVLTPPLAKGLGGRFSLRRAALLSFVGLLFVAPFLFVWRALVPLAGPFPVEGPLLLGFAMTLWVRQLALVGLSHHSPPRSLPAGLVSPLLGFVLVWYDLGASWTYLLEGVCFLFLAFGGSQALVTAVDRPLRREFGEGGVSLLRPLMEHMNDRDPAASDRMERFFEGISAHADLEVGVLTVQRGAEVRLACIVPSVHPGPFAELGSSNLPHKLARELAGSTAREVLTPHAPSTHAQDLPTSGEVARLSAEVRSLVDRAVASPAPERASPLVSPHPGSLARAQQLGDTAWVVLTQAPAPTDDIDYALAEMIRETGRRLGFAHVLVVDAHNSFVENRGEVPFGSPQGYRMLADAEAAMRAAQAAARDGPLRVGFAQRKNYNPEDHGIGPEGLSVLVVEACGARSAYALFDANNLLEGLRAPLVQALERAVEGSAEVLTTDNHVVHEVRGGTNTLGERRGVRELSRDLEEVGRAAVADLAPARVGAAETKVRGLKVLGAGVITRLMTALADSFALFWTFLLASFVLVALAGGLLLAFLR